ncbi:aminotransferase class I/II-fold pyridoxal phosphate-dependent enzyme [Brachybacterium sp. DNPG3]
MSIASPSPRPAGAAHTAHSAGADTVAADVATTGPWTQAASAAGLLAAAAAGPGLDLAPQARPTVFARMSALAAQTGSLNLGQGFPDTDPPKIVAEAAVAAIRAGRNQYPPGAGEAVLREAIVEHQRTWYGLDWNADREVLVTTGATEALAATILALVSPGDEVVTLEPFYDQYAAMIALAGGVHRTVPITATSGPTDGPAADATSETPADAASGAPSDDLALAVDMAALRAAITDRTRLILVNSPHNPTGIMLPDALLAAIVEEAIAHDAIIVTDEVYEHLAYDAPHRPAATFPGAQDRTVSISSAGKTLSVTGWKIGWVTARPELVTAITGVKQWLTYTSGAPFQGAVAEGLRMDAAAFAAIADDLRGKRDLLVDGLRTAGFRVAMPASGYFAVADGSVLGEPDAEALCDRLPEEAGVVAIPLSAFCRDRPDARPLLRVAFCKDTATIEQAVERLAAWAAPHR